MGRGGAEEGESEGGQREWGRGGGGVRKRSKVLRPKPQNWANQAVGGTCRGMGDRGGGDRKREKRM